VSSRRLETIKLTASFKLEREIPLPFELYKKIVNELLDHAHRRHITSFKRLKSEKYRELRARYPKLPSHYIYTACQMACSIYKSFRKLRRRGRVRKDKPEFKKSVIMLDDHLFSIDLEHWSVSLATPDGRVEVRLLHGTYHERFRCMRVGQGWIVKRGSEIYLKVVFSKDIEIPEPNGKAVAVDINENNVTFGSNNNIEQIKTRERVIRTIYFLKRRKLQSKPRLNEKPLLKKYRGREWRRIKEIYHRVADKIIEMARQGGATTIVLENLKNIRRNKKSRELNGRLNRWSFRRLQYIIEYKAKINRLNVAYVKAKGTSSYCPICGGRLSPNGEYRRMKCRKCGYEEDRDFIAVLNLLKRYQMDVGSSSVHPENLPMTGGGKTIRYNDYISSESSG
jgi:putative transposase